MTELENIIKKHCLKRKIDSIDFDSQSSIKR